MSKVLDTINNIIEGEAQEIRAQESNALAAMTLASDNRFRRGADLRAEADLQLRLKQDLEGDLTEAKAALENQLGSEIDDMVDTKFEPVLRQAAVDEGLPYNVDAYSNSKFLKKAKDLYVEKGFTQEQASKILNTVIAYKENPQQRGLMIGFFDDIMQGGTIDSYRKGFTSLGLYGTLPEGVTGADVQAQFARQKGDSALGRFGEIQDVIQGIDTEMAELRKGDMQIQRATIAPKKDFEFDVQSAFTREVNEDLATLNKQIKVSDDRIAMFNTLTADGEYNNAQKAELNILVNEVLADLETGLNKKQKKRIAQTKYNIQFGTQMDRNRKTNATSLKEQGLRNAIKKLNDEIVNIRKTKAEMNTRQKNQISMYEQTFGGTLIEGDKNVYIATPDVFYDTKIKEVQQVINILENDLQSFDE